MKHRPEDFARQFPENGLKLLLQWPHNVRDALRIAHYKQADAIDYDHLRSIPPPTSSATIGTSSPTWCSVVRCSAASRASSTTS